MASVFSLSKELLIGYVITLKLREVVETNLPAKALPSPSQSLDSLIIDIEKKLNEVQRYEASSPWATKSICRVPKSLRDVDENAYTPQIVSIGPYHLGDPRFQEMDTHKWRALHHALKRTGHNVRPYLDAVRSLENRIRACYEPLNIPPTHDFILWLVLDSIFVLELFRGDKEGFLDLGYAPDDPVFTCNGDTIFSLQRDMILLENQLPLFLLDRILALQRGDKLYLSSRVTPLSLSFFENLRPTNDPRQSTLPFDPLSNAGINKALHCLDLLHRNLLQRYVKPSHPSIVDRLSLYFFNNLWPTNSIGKALHCLHVFRRKLLPASSKLASQHSIRNHCSHTEKQRIKFIHCASELHDIGIKFRCRKTDRFWDIQFNNGILEIPHLLIVGGTKSLFLNLIAFEQCHSDCSNDITSYIVFMDSLINSHVDVKYLHHEGIIEHLLENDKDVANLFNRLCYTVDVDNSYLLDLTKKVNSYYESTWNTWKASLKQKYFSNPWTIISLIAAAILLLLTFAQTFYAIYDHYKPN